MTHVRCAPFSHFAKGMAASAYAFGGFTPFFRVFPVLFGASFHFLYTFLHFDVFSSFSTLSLYFRRVRSIFDTCSPFLMRFLHLSRVLLTRPPHDVGWWVHVTPRFGGLPFVFVLTRPPHDVRWRVQVTPRFDELPFTFYFSPDHPTT